MQPLIDDVRALGGAAPKSRLRLLGHTAKSITLAASRGEVQAIGRKWVASPDADSRILSALSQRGVVGGAAALESYGIWVTDFGRHVTAVPQHAHLLPLPDGIERIQSAFEVDPAAPWRVTVLDALVQYCRRASKLDAVASIDSALKQGLVSKDSLKELRSRLPQRCWPWLKQVDGRSEAGTESYIRVACQDEGWNVEIQVPYRGGRLDSVIDGWLAIEVDGSKYHDVAEQAQKDRKRNSQLVKDGYRWHRFSYADVIHNLPETLDVIRTLLRQGRPPGTNRDASAGQEPAARAWFLP